jgi:arsenate reductase
MNSDAAVSVLGALAHDTRLRLYRELVQAGPAGLAAGVLAERLAVPPSSLSFHLSDLMQAGLIAQRRAGRSLIYAADFDRMNALVGFLTENCCGGQSCAPAPKGVQMTERIFNVLFLCTGNSARSILAEALLNQLGKGRFRAFSAGSQPKGVPHPLALDLLRQMKLPVDGLRSKSWDEFAQPGAPELDFIITVCDNAAGEVCPIWPGKPMTAHWGIPDPAAAEGTEAERMLAFRTAYAQMQRRIELFLSLPLASLERMTLQAKLAAIGKTADPA